MTFLLLLVISVGKSYFFIKNANQEIVIDDQYQNPSFVHYSEIVTVVESDERRYNDNIGWDRMSDGSYGKYESYSRTYTYAELGLTGYPSYLGIRRVDAVGGGFTMLTYTSVHAIDGDYTSEIIGFKYRIYSMELGAKYQMVCFANLSQRIPSRSGLAIYNEKRELIFDAELGYMQVMDSQYHLRDLFSSSMQSFPVHNSNLPDVDYSNMYLIVRQRPYATTGGTITINYRQYVSRLRKDAATGQIYVDLGMWGKTGGKRLQQYQSAFSFMVAYIHF